jgi:mannitol-1-/sugar-/sorbitol-6-phosphatase
MAPRHLTFTVAGIVVALEDVLLDAAAARESTWRWWASRVGQEPDLIVEAAWGRHAADVIAEFAPAYDLAEEAAALLARERILLRTARRGRGAGGFLRGIPPGRLAVRSSGAPEQVDARLRRARLTDLAVVLTAADVPIGPPSPDGHRLAAERLGVPPDRCLAIDGSPAGTAAGVAAEMATVFVQEGIERVVPPGATAVVDSLGSLRVEPTEDGVAVTCRVASPLGW